MYINKIYLKTFRNYETLNIDFSRDINIIYGNNAQGKTNILEAIYICATGRSHRTSKDVELIKAGNKNYFIKVKFNKLHQNENQIELCYDIIEKKKIKINEIPIKKIGDLMGKINAVMFSPEDLQIVKEGPAERRRFVDIAISQIKPRYFFDLQQYVKVLNQRNILLRELEYKKSSISTLDTWNQSLIEYGSRIIKQRIEFLKVISDKARLIHSKVTDNTENLEIKYIPSIGIEDKNYENDEIRQLFENRLLKLKDKEIYKKVTLVGPQRDDIEILINSRSIKQYGSQGQQRTAVLSLKLTEVEIIKDDIGEYPVLLLDDVMSELDLKRREYLINNIKGIQTFITCTDKNNFIKRFSSNSKFIKIENGISFSEEI